MTNNRLWVFGASALVVAILVLGYFFGVVPKLGDASASQALADQVNTQNAATQTQNLKLKKQYENITTLDDQLAALQLSIPGTTGTNTFVDQVVSIAARTHVAVTSIKATEPALWGGAVTAVPAPAASATPGATPTPAAPSTGAATTTAPAGVSSTLYTVQISVAVNGAPSDVVAFTAALQSGVRLYLITKVSFTGSVTGSSAGTSTSKSSGSAAGTGSTGNVSGYIFVVPAKGSPSPTASPTPIPSASPTASAPTPTATPTH